MQEARHIPQIIGANIAARRAEMDLSRRALAILIGTDQTLIYKWERGLHRPGDSYMAKLVTALERDIAWFYTEHPAVERTAA